MALEGSASGPLAGLKVLDVTDDLGRFATKLFAEAGADVVRIATTELHNDHGPDMADSAASSRGGLLDWWYDGGKRVTNLDLDRAEDQDRYRALAAAADIVIDTMKPGRLAALGLDHSALLRAGGANPRLVQVSLTPFGQEGPWAQWASSDIVAGALGGVLSVSGSPDRAINPFGRQNNHFGAFMAATCGLAGLYSARQTGAGQHIDLSLHDTLATSIEQLWFQYWFDDALPLPKIAPRQGSLHWLGVYVVTQCKTGWTMISPTPSPQPLFEWMAEEGMEGAAEIAEMTVEQALAIVPEVMRKIAEFALTKDSGELFEEAQRRHVAFGEVQGVAKVAANPQHEFRHFFQPVAWDGPAVVRPTLPLEFHGTPAPPTQPPPAAAEPIDDLINEWGRNANGNANGKADSANSATPKAPDSKPLDGLRVLDLSWVLAGPFCCRILGDLGADIVKVQTAERATLPNDPNFPYYYCWNRSKRSVAMNMKHPGALAIARKLVEASDVLIENYSAGVLARWGLDYETVRSWNPGIVYVSMSGCGHDGPWSNMITYAPTIHALCGLTALSNPADRGDIGPGFSLNDHAVGFMAAFAILSAVEACRRSADGAGQHVDISQLEVGGYLTGAALTDYLTNGRETTANGNVDPYAAYQVNDVFVCAEGELAVTVRNDDDAAALRGVVGNEDLAAWCKGRTATDAMYALQGAGIPAGRVQNGDVLTHEDEQIAARNLLGMMKSDTFGERPFDRFPAKWSTSNLEPYRCAPAYLGEHNFEVLTELAGMTEEEIATAMGDDLLT